ncbi:MAG: SGNH/GDSL hydrolase family protein [Xenococcaceae cyanobacterium MO_207.B15]|nr:SGNH/GDSL hydrolase family protein [Xenococcaceae cyanobacterium MO_207.B15]
MFKSKPKERYLFTTRRPKRRFPLIWFVVSAVLSLLVVELITRIIVDVTGNREEFAQATETADISQNYELKYVNQQGEILPTSPEDGVLAIKPSLSVGYQLVSNQENPYWKINEQGFRDTENVSLTKAKDEIRIFLLGGSTAFGYGSSSNKSAIAEQLELRLQQRIQQQRQSPSFYKPDVLPLDEAKRKQALAKPSKIKSGNYHVINAAVPGYASGNGLAQLALQILSYKPDLVIVLDGYQDLMLDSKESAVQIPLKKVELDDAPSYMRASVGKLLQPLEDKSYLVKILQDSVLTPQVSNQEKAILFNEPGNYLTAYAPQDQAELQRRVDRYFKNHKQMVNLAAGAGIPVIMATQPEITGRNPAKLTPTEGEITTQLGREYINTIKENYPRFVAVNQYLAKIFPQNVTAINLYNLNDKYPSPSFIDAIHLTDNANTMVAEQLYYAIASLPKMQIVPRIPPKPVKPTVEKKVEQNQKQNQEQNQES